MSKVSLTQVCVCVRAYTRDMLYKQKRIPYVLLKSVSLSNIPFSATKHNISKDRHTIPQAHTLSAHFSTSLPTWALCICVCLNVKPGFNIYPGYFSFPFDLLRLCVRAC